MSFLVDTDICSAHLKQRGPVTNRFLQYTGRLNISAVTVGELFTWALRANAPPQRLQALLDLFNDVTILDVTENVGRKFGELHKRLCSMLASQHRKWTCSSLPPRSSTI
jgi:predicted nucleic acid-binding protein